MSITARACGDGVPGSKPPPLSSSSSFSLSSTSLESSSSGFSKTTGLQDAFSSTAETLISRTFLLGHREREEGEAEGGCYDVTGSSTSERRAHHRRRAGCGAADVNPDRVIQYIPSPSKRPSKYLKTAPITKITQIKALLMTVFSYLIPPSKPLPSSQPRHVRNSESANTSSGLHLSERVVQIPWRDVVSCYSVCKEWYEGIDDQVVWRAMRGLRCTLPKVRANQVGKRGRCVCVCFFF